MTMDALEEAEARLGHVFSCKALLREALTHRSYGAPHNERLEFLGDALLGALVAHALFTLYPEASEGELSRLRSRLVCGSALAEAAKTLDLGESLFLGEGERKSGGAQRESILAGALEAFLGAIWLDAGLGAALGFMQRCLGEKINRADTLFGKDAKTRLQEFLQKGKFPLPEYEVLLVSGKAPEEEFLVRAKGAGEESLGKGKSRREAEQEAAQALMALLEKKNA